MADISKITLPSNTTYNIKDATARNNSVWYGESSTASTTLAKTVSISGITTLSNGLSIRVKFDEGCGIDSPTLNLNSLGAKPIVRPQGTFVELPSGYTQYEWVNSAQIDLGFKTKNTMTFEAKWLWTGSAQYLYNSDSNSSGTTNTTSYLSSGGNWRFGNKTISINGISNTVFTSVQNSSGITLNGVSQGSYSGVNTFTSSSNLKMGASSLAIRYYYLKVWDSDTLILNLVPCSNGTNYGFYDLVNDDFYSGGESATAGSETSGDASYSNDNVSIGEWVDGEIIDLVYDGTNWVIVNGSIADTQSYGFTKLSNLINSTATNVAATPKAVKLAYETLDNIKQDNLPSQDNTTDGRFLRTNYDSVTSTSSLSWGAVQEVTTLSIDSSPTSSSDNLVTSGGVWSALQNVNGLPSQSGNSGKFLTTDGSSASWGTVDTLPSQTNNSGKVLSTNGTNALWTGVVTASSVGVDSSPTASSTNLVESGGVYSAITTKLNRTTAVNVVDTNYSTVMARGISAGTTDLTAGTSELTSGTIYIYYE